MPEEFCKGDWNNGVPMFKVHGERLVDRDTAKAKLGKLDQPMIGVWFCPVSGSMLSFSIAGHDAVRETATKLPKR